MINRERSKEIAETNRGESSKNVLKRVTTNVFLMEGVWEVRGPDMSW